MCYIKCKEKHERRAKALHLEARMYRYSNGQVSLSDFKQPVGMNLKESNRWVKKAQTIPWTEIEKRYAALFTNRKGKGPTEDIEDLLLKVIDAPTRKRFGRF